jgi:hypothetical protein
LGGAPQDEDSWETGAQAGSAVVTDFAAQTLEIMGSLPELQAVSEDGGEASTPRPHPEEPKKWASRRMLQTVPAQRPSRRTVLGGAPQDEDSCENSAQAGSAVVTDFVAQTIEIMGSLPELQPASDDRGDPREAAAASTLSACHPGEIGDPEAAAATSQTERLNLDACARGHDTAGAVEVEPASRNSKGDPRPENLAHRLENMESTPGPAGLAQAVGPAFLNPDAGFRRINVRMGLNGAYAG